MKGNTDVNPFMAQGASQKREKKEYKSWRNASVVDHWLLGMTQSSHSGTPRAVLTSVRYTQDWAGHKFHRSLSNCWQLMVARFLQGCNLVSYSSSILL